MLLQHPPAPLASASARPRYSRARAVAAPASSSSSVQGPVEAQAFNQLLAFANIQPPSVELAATQHSGNGLQASRAVQKGQVLISVPRGLSIIVDYENGLQVPEGSWPRLRQGASAPDPLPWDLLMALALVDGLAGDGDAFWESWCRAVLPPPEGLMQPFCWDAPALEQLQHPAIVDGALKQQERLRALFPELSAPGAPGQCSWLAWAFACVRSRSIKVSDDAFALVPFLDMCNHAQPPNANFRLDAASGQFEVYALQELQQGQQVTISYSGEEGFSNQRFMAQYGFVPEGNLADRLELDMPAGSTAQGSLQLERVQDRLGDAVLMDAATGHNPYLWAALKSLPFAPEAEGQGGDGRGEDHLRLARALEQQCVALKAGFATTLEQDEALLAAADAGTAAAPAAPLEPRLLAAVRYRVERKRLIKACMAVLAVYARD